MSLEIISACAGAGKTSSLSKVIKDAFFKKKLNYKKIYVLTYTNNAVFVIKKKLIEEFKIIPKDIVVETIHKYFLDEIIYPYSYDILGINYDFCINKSLNYMERNKLKKYFDSKGIILSSCVINTAKKIIVSSNSSTLRMKQIQNNLLSIILAKTEEIFIDEVQDMEKDFFEIIDRFINANLKIYMVGDYRQAIKYPNIFFEFMKKNITNVKEKNDSYRVPINHLKLVNSVFQNYMEMNSINKTTCGQVYYLFEDEIDNSFFDEKLCYIREKNDSYSTNKSKKANKYKFDDYILESLEKTYGKNKSLCATIASNKLDELLNEYDLKETINNFFLYFKINYKKESYRLLINQLEAKNNSIKTGINVNSIDSVKGLENENCVFILDNAMAKCLVKGIGETKTKCQLYVSLTRSSDKLYLIFLNKITDVIRSEIELFMIANNVVKFK